MIVENTPLYNTRALTQLKNLTLIRVQNILPTRSLSIIFRNNRKRRINLIGYTLIQLTQTPRHTKGTVKQRR
jgi:hypothetical protein